MAGCFEPLLGEEDAIVSDSLNHASIIDGVRLCKAKKYRFHNADLDDLETQLKAARANGARTVLIATDGVFSMDGYYAPLAGICALADRYDALVMVDDCHATGFTGPKGAGTHARAGVADRVDILTGTFGKALGGAMGGYIAAKKSVIDLLRQRARPYLFSNALAPAITASSLKAIDLAEAGDDLRDRITANAERFRVGLTQAGFDLLPGSHPIIPVMLYDAKLAQAMAAKLLDEGIYVIGFSFPVVPDGKARIRTQISAAHTFDQIDKAIAAFYPGRQGIGSGTMSGRCPSGDHHPNPTRNDEGAGQDPRRTRHLGNVGARARLRARRRADQDHPTPPSAALTSISITGMPGRRRPFPCP